MAVKMEVIKEKSLGELSAKGLLELREMLHQIDCILYEYRHVSKSQNIINTKMIDGLVNEINFELDKMETF